MKRWKQTTIGETCTVVNGGTPKTSEPSYWGGEHLWITPAEMGKRSSPLADDTARKLTDAGLQDSSARLLPPGSVILSSRAPIGHLVINTKPMSTNQGCKGLVPGPMLDHKYLFYYLGSIVPLLNDLGTGATFKELSSGKLNDVPLPLPPLAEQQRIVAILDGAFAGLQAMRAHAAKNLQNARELAQSELDSVFAQTGTGRRETTLGATCVFENGDRGENYPSRHVRTASGIPFINAGHLAGSYIDFSQMDFIPRERFELLGSGKVQPNDVLFCLRGSLGKFGKVGDLKEGAIASSLVILRPGPEILTGYLIGYLGSAACRSMIERFRNGAAQPNLSAASLRKFEITLPPVEEQRALVERLEEIASITSSLESIYRRKLALTDALKQSILQKAFSGELTAPVEIAA